MKTWRCLALVILLGVGCGTLSHESVPGSATAVIEIGPFSAVGQAGHQARIQSCLDAAGDRPTVFKFAPGDYALVDAGGLRVPAHAMLLMEGARFLISPEIREDGQAFLLQDVSDVTLRGGEIVGSRDAWAPSVNVAGVRVRGASSRIRIADLVCRDVSSNAVGVFGASDDAPIRDVSLERVAGIDCCNLYVDYLQPNPGPVSGSVREDQGTVAFYYVDGWSVDGCRFEGSRSDGTHFYHCRNGRFADSSVTGSQMGGYFLEGCENVIASGCLISGNGSRGVTIERDSRYCTLSSSLVTHSGREGLWMPDACSVIITDNLFVENGRKDDGERDCEIRLDDTAEYATETRDIRIEGNLFHASAEQTAVIYCGAGVSAVAVENNTFQGSAPRQHCGEAK